jgi:hypothetical protein
MMVPSGMSPTGLMLPMVKFAFLPANRNCNQTARAVKNHDRAAKPAAAQLSHNQFAELRRQQNHTFAPANLHRTWPEYMPSAHTISCF